MHLLMNKDIPVIEIETLRVLNYEMCPIALKLNNLNNKILSKWVSDRKAPINRANYDKIFNNAPNHLSFYISINDNFWIKEENSGISYKDVSIFNNDLDINISKSAITGMHSISEHKLLSAEYTGQGTYPKCFIKEQDNLYIYKSGIKEQLNNELKSSLIAYLLEFRSVKYEEASIFDLACTKSKILTNEEINWETAFSLCTSLNERGYTPQNYALQFFTKSYSNMIIFDALILNEDRHMKNWAIEVEADTNRIIGLSPSFDYNNAFIGNSHTMSNLLFDGPKKMNILKAGREAYRNYGTTLNIEYLYNVTDNLQMDINKGALKNRIEYIVGVKDNQRGCY